MGYGRRAVATLIYYRQKGRFEAEFDTFDEALNVAAIGLAYMTLAAERIIDGDRVVDGDELDELCHAREAELGLT
jgi:hypothetical protein